MFILTFWFVVAIIKVQRRIQGPAGAAPHPPPLKCKLICICSQRNSGNRTSEDALTFFFGFHLILGGKLASEDVKTFFFVFTDIFSVNRKLRPPIFKFLGTLLKMHHKSSILFKNDMLANNAIWMNLRWSIMTKQYSLSKTKRLPVYDNKKYRLVTSQRITKIEPKTLITFSRVARDRFVEVQFGNTGCELFFYVVRFANQT